MRRGFTLIELAVAVGLLAMIFLLSSSVFKVSIDSQRLAAANADIMQKLRAITDQLNADLKGAIWNAPGQVVFETAQSKINGQQETVRSDRIVFFATGDFETTREYPAQTGETTTGNTASIYYGLADTGAKNPREKILVRRQTVLTSDSNLPANGGLEDRDEYHETSLAEWRTNPPVTTSEWIKRLDVEPNDLKQDDIVVYMAGGVDDFTIQYVGWDDTGREFNQWRPTDIEADGWDRDFVPRAFKFSFRLYDSKGVIKNGREFTHIVYLGK